MATIITVESLSKAYRIGHKEKMPDTLVGAAKCWVGNPIHNLRSLRRLDTYSEETETEDVVWALRDVSFEVRQGDVVGIIGRNGAGKSTLLKILSNITEPTRGRAIIRGRISSLLEVGTGFHQEMTGRDNIYMNGTILGMTKQEIARKFDEIVDFSGVERFLDTPIKRYSSGMQVRLAFAVAAHLEPEILIVDEVLAVGDLAFQQKCLGKMNDVARSGRTVLLVSHNMVAVETLCTRGLLIHAGQILHSGEIRHVVELYQHEMCSNALSQGDPTAFRKCRLIKSVKLVDANGVETRKISLGSEFHAIIQLEAPMQIKSPVIGVGIDDSCGFRALTVHTPTSRDPINRLEGTCDVHCRIRPFPLPPGQYTLKIVLNGFDEISGVGSFIVTDANAFGEGRGFHRGVCVAPSEWWSTNKEYPHQSS
jgi:lipopolysaccharide transport system ATP-binding protein